MVVGTSEVVLLDSTIYGGIGDSFPGCLQGASSGVDLSVGSSARVVSNRDIPFKYIASGGSFAIEAALPVLDVTAPATSPGAAAFALNAEVGTNGRNFMGRSTALAPLGAAVIPRAHNFSFGQFMGVTGATGVVTSSLVIPPGRRGTVFFSQGASTDLNGRTALSNPVALVTR